MMEKYIQTVTPKGQIVEETFAEGASVSAIARANGLNADLVFKWCKLYQAVTLSGRGGSRLLPLKVTRGIRP